MVSVTITNGAEERERERRASSTIAFPYSDIDDAVSVANGLLKGGGMALSRDQLAAAMGLAPGGGGFNTKINTARTFGAIETVTGKYQLTELGFELADPNRQREAMVTAFLNVDLYRRVYDEFRGKRLPPRPHGLEAAFVNFGVAPKQGSHARIAFDRSARKAGFFPNGDEERLVMPFGQVSITGAPSAADVIIEQGNGISTLAEAKTNAALVNGAQGNLHSSIVTWLAELPAPKSEWSKEEQVDWLQALAVMFRTIYKSDTGSIDITIKRPQNGG